MAAVVAIKDEQLFTLAQTGHGRDLRLGRGGVLGQDVASPGRDDPAPARPRQHAAGSEISPVRALGCSCASQRLARGWRPRVRTSGARGRLERNVAHGSLASEHRRVLHPSGCPLRQAGARGSTRPREPAACARECVGTSIATTGRSRTEHCAACSASGIRDEHPGLFGGG
jgi:hypothetical protein